MKKQKTKNKKIVKKIKNKKFKTKKVKKNKIKKVLKSRSSSHSRRKKIAKLSFLEKKAANLTRISNELIEKGRKRGFITYDEKYRAKRIERGELEAKNLLARAKLRLVVSIAKKYVGRSANLTLLDLIQ